jgi:hypothetical protein
MVALREAQEFFETLYGEEAPGFLPIFTHTPKRTRWVAADSPAEAARIALESGRERDTYFGIGLHKEALGENKRGTADEVIALPGLWADLDVKGEAHEANNLPPTGQDAMRITEVIPLRPTLIVHSGHGLQAWWLFKELWVFENEAERKEAQELSRRFQATLKQRAREYGWLMDGTHDISRVFRPPGTYNHKLEPVEVRVLDYDEGARYNPSDFGRYLVEATPEEEREVSFEGNNHDPEAARVLLGLLRDRLSPRILKAVEGGPDSFEPLPGGDATASAPPPRSSLGWKRKRTGKSTETACWRACSRRGTLKRCWPSVWRSCPGGSTASPATRRRPSLSRRRRWRTTWLTDDGLAAMF